MRRVRHIPGAVRQSGANGSGAAMLAAAAGANPAGSGNMQWRAVQPQHPSARRAGNLQRAAPGPAARRKRQRSWYDKVNLPTWTSSPSFRVALLTRSPLT